MSTPFFGGATGECLKEASTFSSGPSLVLLASAAAVKADPRRLGHEKRRFLANRRVKPNSCFVFLGKDFLLDIRRFGELQSLESAVESSKKIFLFRACCQLNLKFQGVSLGDSK